MHAFIHTIKNCGKALSQVGFIIFIVLFVYSVIGMSLFGHLSFNSIKVSSMNKIINFQRFSSSFCLLFRLTTIAGWNNVLNDVIEQNTKVKSSTAKKGSMIEDHVLTIIYFTSFIIVIALVLMNVLVALFLQHYYLVVSQHNYGITDSDLDAYYSVWQNFDPKATHYINFSQLRAFLGQLKHPLKIDNAQKYMELKIPVNQAFKCHCLDILEVLVSHVLSKKTSNTSDDFISLKREIFKRKFSSSLKLFSNEATKYQYHASQIIQRNMRQYLLWKYFRGLLDSPDSFNEFESIGKLLREMFTSKQTENKYFSKFKISQ